MANTSYCLIVYCYRRLKYTPVLKVDRGYTYLRLKILTNGLL